jgi:hypothetical protein
MQFLFLSSWIGSTKLLQSKIDAVLYLGLFLKMVSSPALGSYQAHSAGSSET